MCRPGGTAHGAGNRTELEYHFSKTQNNGNLVKQVTTRNLSHSWTQDFTYDGVNRLTSAIETGGWSRGYG
ncbi:MAG TPA: hypothetical protein VLL97_06610 [Acidobacteriota bacterium]|nr:hypothetical protein [Acidobacteriota bacterium]